MINKLTFLFLLTLVFGCQKKVIPTQFTENEKLGREIYQKNCLVCHHPNPIETGTVGPDLADSSYELIYKRVTSLEYPTGYKPKRNTQLMPEFKHLSEPEIKALYEFIQAFQKANE